MEATDSRPTMLVLRALKLGDLLVAVPALTALRRHWPGHRIVLATSGWLAPIVDLVDGVDELLGPFDVWAVCPHGPDEGCGCRKPAPGLVLDAARALGVPPADLVVIGDIGADVGAARAAGSRAVLVPTPVTRRAEVEAAPSVAATLLEAVELALASDRVQERAS